MGTLFEVNKDEGSVVEVYKTVPPNIISVTLNSDQDDWNPTGLQEAGLIRITINGDRTLSGMVAPPAGVNKIIALASVTTNDDNLKIRNNDSSSNAANRFLVRDNGGGSQEKSIKEGETGYFWYDHLSERWRPLNRIG